MKNKKLIIYSFISCIKFGIIRKIHAEVMTSVKTFGRNLNSQTHGQHGSSKADTVPQSARSIVLPEPKIFNQSVI